MAKDISIEKVTPHYADGVRFPFPAKLPLWLCQASGMGRQIIVSGPDQQLPKVIVDWMAEHPVFCKKLAAREQGEIALEAKAQDDFSIFKGVGPTVTKKLHGAGIHTFDDLAQVSADVIVKIAGRPMTATKAEKIIEQAKNG